MCDLVFDNGRMMGTGFRPRHSLETIFSKSPQEGAKHAKKKDKLDADGRKEKTSLLFTDLNICLTYAENDLRANWKFYRERFLKEAGT